LDEFISATLVGIQRGVQRAIEERSKEGQTGGVINPVFGKSVEAGINAGRDLQKVEFDVAVTVSDKSSKDGKAGIRVFSIELGGGASTGAEHSIVSRVKFTVPVIPPVQLVLPVESPPRSGSAMREDSWRTAAPA
jgi:hypothetical protein